MNTPHPASALTAKQAVLRFAPSPNGPLHRGHALSAWLNQACAQRLGGRLLLRIEDIDPARSRSEHIAAIEETLAWLGVGYERPVRRQSQHMAMYRDAFERLKARGLVYPCFCTRGEIEKAVEAQGPDWPRDPDGSPIYPRRCHGLSADVINDRLAGGDEPQWRLDMPKAVALAGPLHWQSFDPATFEVTSRKADPSRWGDGVVVRKDTPTSYHLSVVVDDAEQGVTHVVRGTDLEASTDIHVLLQELLGLPHPVYWHHGLITGPDGKKLAKSRNSGSLAMERENGLTRERLQNEFQSAGLSNAEECEP